MKLWKLTQNDENGYDTYDACIVAAPTEREARKILPSEFAKFGDGTWARGIKTVKAELVGEAKKGTKAGVILASFNAG